MPKVLSPTVCTVPLLTIVLLLPLPAVVTMPDELAVMAPIVPLLVNVLLLLIWIAFVPLSTTVVPGWTVTTALSPATTMPPVPGGAQFTMVPFWVQSASALLPVQSRASVSSAAHAGPRPSTDRRTAAQWQTRPIPRSSPPG
jgi:hypothetical protein